MKIVGFGDSFIHHIDKKNHDENNCLYTHYVGNHFNTEFEARGRPGSGPWHMFFDFLNYSAHVDVAVMVWSEIHRLFHHSLTNLNFYTAKNTKEGPDLEIYKAANDYYKFLYFRYQKDWELKALMCMFDEMITKKYPDTKFIHLPAFSYFSDGKWPIEEYKNITVDKLEYYYDFKNSVEIRPCLMWLSMEDEWPNQFAGDQRPNHLTSKNHKMLGKAIVHAIENYTPGKKINVYDFAE